MNLRYPRTRTIKTPAPLVTRLDRRDSVYAPPMQHTPSQSTRPGKPAPKNMEARSVDPVPVEAEGMGRP